MYDPRNQFRSQIDRILLVRGEDLILCDGDARMLEEDLEKADEAINKGDEGEEDEDEDVDTCSHLEIRTESPALRDSTS
jgi:hypothetical protein